MTDGTILHDQPPVTSPSPASTRGSSAPGLGLAGVASAPTPFQPIPVESPGGGRISDKRDPLESDLVWVHGHGKQVRLHRLAARAWEAMAVAARADGIPAPLLLPVSGYRNGTLQRQLWERALRRYNGDPQIARQWVAPPGSSAHESGRAIDFYLGTSNDSHNVATQRQTQVYAWLAANAKRFGFYPYSQEPWHWEYNPPASDVVHPEGRELELEGPQVRAGELADFPHVPILESHRGKGTALILRWNDMRAAPAEIDVVVHLHGYANPWLDLTHDIKGRSGLDLRPTDGVPGTGRARPTLTILPRGNFTGVKQTNGPWWVYTFPALDGTDGHADGLTRLTKFALEQFAAATGLRIPGVARRILTAHSGGGLPLLRMLHFQDPDEVHLYDGLYSEPNSLVDWARRHLRQDRAGLASAGPDATRAYMATRGSALRIFYGRTTHAYSRTVQAAVAPEATGGLDRWYRVEATALAHLEIPRQYGWRMLADPADNVPDIVSDEQLMHPVHAPGSRGRHGELEAEAFIEDVGRLLRGRLAPPGARPPAAATTASRFTLPPDPPQLLPAARTHVTAIPLFPGDVALAAEVKLIREIASRPDGWVYMTNWYASLDCPVPEDTRSAIPAGCTHAAVPWHSTLRDVLRECGTAHGTIRALFWDGSQTINDVDPVLDVALQPLSFSLTTAAAAKLAQPLLRRWLRAFVTDKATNLTVNRGTADFINHNVPNGLARLDDATLSFGSHHQKILVVGNSERTVAVIGGVDWHPNRKQHIDAGTPYFDISVQIDGPAAADVADLFEHRWRAAADRAPLPLPRRQGPTAAATAGATVQIGPNFGCGQPLTDNKHAIRSGAALIRNALRNCRTFFYGEDQYGIGNHELADGMRQAFANGARYGVIVLANAEAVDDIPDLRFRRYQFWSQFPQTSRNLFVFERLGDNRSGPNGPHAYVHSKLFLVDDEAAMIGSMNMNRRSWYHDSEIAALLTDAPALLRDLRLGIWRCHLPDVPEQSLADPVAALQTWFTLHSTPFVTRGNLSPIWFAKPPSRWGDSWPLSSAIHDAVDVAHDRLFDPAGPASCG